ncbi:fasciclin domain-containing protein [Pleurocapsales cyanobacterium LEGE 10410]|nr:fasciclin domain-containing protein [Pleurocapsales cyanobacterium LEGE 10410]
MTINFSTLSKYLLVLTGVLGLGSLSISPALADNHTDSMDSFAEMEQMPVGQTNTEVGNIVEVASGNETFSTLVKAVEAAGLGDTLSDSSASYTVFAPTDEAFNQLPEGTLEYLLQPENQEVLQQVLSYHVLPEQVTASEISGGTVDSLNGGLATAVTDAGVVINNASVITPDIEASNGVIHAVNRVLLPSDLQSSLASELGIEETEIYQ